jgi:hypothetical protein
MIFGPGRDVNFGPLHSSLWLDALSQANLSFELLPLHLWGDGQATLKDHIDLIHLIFIIGVSPMMFSLPLLLHHGLFQHLLAI